MRTLKEIKEHLASLESVFGFNPCEVEQGSPEWHVMKHGIPSASNSGKLLSKKGTATRQTYMNELIAQVATGLTHEISAKPLEWGRAHEDSARVSYEFAQNITPHELPFIYKTDLEGFDLRVGCSPDGYSDARGMEIKCPFNTTNHIEFLANDKIKPEYIKQVQYSMWITGQGQWDFASYDPRMTVMPIKIVTIDRDEKLMTEFDEKVPEFLTEMDVILNKLGLEFGAHWERFLIKNKKEEVAA